MSDVDLSDIDENYGMDEKVASRLDEFGMKQWRQGASIADLVFVLQSVVEIDNNLDRQYRILSRARKILKDNRWLVSQLEDAWKTGSYRDVRELDILQAPESSWGYKGYMEPEPLSDTQLNALKKALTSTYQGRAVDAFHAYLTQNNEAFHKIDGQRYYGKFCSIVQSSGTGKTRLMLELHRKDVCVLYMNIRSPNDIHGYPSRDHTPADILTRPCDTENQYRRHCYGFFAAVFKVLRTVLEKNQPNWSEDVCKIGSPTRVAFFVDLENEYENVRDEIRTEYLRGNIMKKYYLEMVSSKSFPQAKDNEPRVVIALDEAYVLHNDGGRPFSQANVLLQTIKEYSEDNDHAVWVVVASTTFKVARFASLEALSFSERIAVEEQLLFLPFSQLGWDQNAPALGEVQPDKVAKAGHILRYGRPLWVSLKEVSSLNSILNLAAQKLCGAVVFDPSDVHQAFAVLAQRFGLDIAFGGRDAIRHVETLVESHLRVCINTTEDRIWSYTTYPSEPILSCIAAELLHVDDKLCRTLQRLGSMADQGVVDIGQIGELVSRFLWLLAKDFFVREKAVRKDVGREFDQTLEGCKLVPVVEFLEFVFGPKIWEEKPEAQKEFKNAFINFSHWVSMNYNIRRDEGLDQLPIEQWTLCHWERTSALQCCDDQPLIDKVIPMYFKPQNPGDRTGISQILISDKARISSQKAGLKDIRREHWSIAPDHRAPRLPYIAILVDLGVEMSDFDAWVDSSEDRDICLRILAHGLDATTYPFLLGRDRLTCILKDLYKRENSPCERSLLQDLEDQMRFGRTSEPRNMNLKKRKMKLRKRKR